MATHDSGRRKRRGAAALAAMSIIVAIGSVARVRHVETALATPASGDPGARVYAQHCALCHGAGGKGDGPAAATLKTRPRNHTDGAYMNSRTDAQLLNSIRNGKGAMPAWKGSLSESEIQAVLGHVRSLAVPPYHGHRASVATPTRSAPPSGTAPGHAAAGRRHRHSSRTSGTGVKPGTHAK